RSPARRLRRPRAAPASSPVKACPHASAKWGGGAGVPARLTRTAVGRHGGLPHCKRPMVKSAAMQNVSESPLVEYRFIEGVALLTLVNPPANTYSYQMMQALDAAILQARFDESVHVILLTGAGDKIFCAGADISMLDRVSPAFKYNFCL